MWHKRVRTLTAATMLIFALGLTGCQNKGVTTYVSGFDGTNPEVREQLAQLERQGSIRLADEIDPKTVDYIVLAPLPAYEAPADASARPVLGRLEWFATLDAHTNDQAAARQHNIPVVELPRFLEMVEAGETERRRR